MDLISRQAAIDALEEPCKVPDTWTDEYAVGERMQWEKDVKALNSLPSAKRKKGEWVPAKDGMDGHVKCNQCFKTYDYDSEAQYYNFCPMCGADMRERKEE